MKISVIVPSLDQGRFLGACLESILAQQGVVLEVLVFDGGSSDRSPEIIERYADRLHYRQCRPDGGQAAALRAGFERATGELLCWVNSDDLLLPGALQSAVGYLSRNPRCPLVYGSTLWIDADGALLQARREIEFDWKILAFGYSFLPQPATVFRREAYRRVSGIDPQLQCCMDHDLWHQLVQLGPPTHLPCFLAAMRDHAATKTRRMAAMFRREEDLLRQRYLGVGRVRYHLQHYWHRARRVALRAEQGCYRELGVEERRWCERSIRRYGQLTVDR